MAVFVEKGLDGCFDVESKLIMEYCTANRIPTQVFEPFDICSGKLSLKYAQLVVGCVGAVKDALKTLGAAPPSLDPYPASLRPYLRRAVWPTTVENLLNRVQRGEMAFAKSMAWGLVPGNVYSPDCDNNALHYAPPALDVYASEVVEWLCEFRLYVVDGVIVGGGQYAGPPGPSIDMRVVHRALKAFQADPAAPRAFAMDWGVMARGHTALVQVKDAWSLRAFGDIRAASYYRVLKARWNELVGAGRVEVGGRRAAAPVFAGRSISV
ncbi:ATP-grasp domain-containing protein [Microbulbifer elongatus]|uniref:ATP-grasp domain-containing protein n=1 Tax=Microbulbifer elongatus TaxID=86173 RepID=A0ABT1P3P9_9GAMM|nr:ATP-grasp domain-containing protein [Microbulbifer elongatus]MCQ3829666.1 ATP-grasp domain-containing protein [Microbulbifer elongatus]